MPGKTKKSMIKVTGKGLCTDFLSRKKPTIKAEKKITRLIKGTPLATAETDPIRAA